MPSTRAPVWLYVIAASFLGLLVIQTYAHWLGTMSHDFAVDDSGGRMVVTRVTPNTAAALAGLRAGDYFIEADGTLLHRYGEWWTLTSQFKAGRPIPIRIERSGHESELSLVPEVSSHARVFLWQSTRLITLLLALLIAFRRSHDLIALLAAWVLATVAITDFLTPVAASVLRQLPWPFTALLFIPLCSSSLLGGIFPTFCAMFPRRLSRMFWFLGVIWTIVLIKGLWVLSRFGYYPTIFHPERFTYLNFQYGWVSAALTIGCVIVGLAALIVNYGRLSHINERRRVRLIVTGILVGGCGLMMHFAILLLDRWSYLGSPLEIVAVLMFLTLPLLFAYAVLRQRVFDLGVIVRQGIQYAAARGVLLYFVPATVLALFLDLLLHRQQTIAAVLTQRGWLYVTIIALVSLAHHEREEWMEALDRRFFREHYNAQQILREVVERLRNALSLEVVAPTTVACIEHALHPEFVSLFLREPRHSSCISVASSPQRSSLLPLPANSRILGLLRVLNKPLEFSGSNSAWQHQLAEDDLSLISSSRIDLLVPITLSSGDAGRESFLALGPRLSEEPYSGEDKDLLCSIAASLALLLAKAAVPDAECFHECAECGACYNRDVSRCPADASLLITIPMPGLLAQRYRLDRRIGHGGMGTVYAATDIELHRHVAAKLIREGLVGNPGAAQRFSSEARAAAGFCHPNVVTIHDFGVTSANRAFLIMELLEGRALRQEMNETRTVPGARTLQILRGVCAGLEAAHQKQLVHRDLKPENIFIARTGAIEIPKLLDFGLAKFLPPPDSLSAETASADLVGTPRYMSPEQMRGLALEPHWDLWALSVIAYEMLCGQHPFATGIIVEFRSGILEGRCVPVNQYLPDAPPGLPAFFEAAFSVNPVRRPSSVKEWLESFERALAGDFLRAQA